MRTFFMMLALVACFGLAVTGCEKKEETPTVDDAMKKGEDAAGDAKKAMDDATTTKPGK